MNKKIITNLKENINKLDDNDMNTYKFNHMFH